MRYLVGLDGSPQAAWGLDLVQGLQLTSADEVILASVVEVPIGLVALPGYEEVREEALGDGRRIVADATSRLAGPARMESLVVEGHPVEMLQRLALERLVDLVVVGPHGRGRLESLLVGSVSQGLLHSLRTSILVARPIRHGFRTVVLAVDGSAHSRAAMELLATLPLPDGTTVICTSVVPSASRGYGRAWPEDVLTRLEAEERAAAQAAIEDAVAVVRRPALSVAGEVRKGSPKQAILEALVDHQADLAVLGARGLGGFEALVLGSVSRAVSKAAPCSVLVVHTPAPEA